MCNKTFLQALQLKAIVPSVFTIRSTHYLPWVDTSTSNIAALWSCCILPNCGQNTFVQ